MSAESRTGCSPSHPPQFLQYLRILRTFVLATQIEIRWTRWKRKRWVCESLSNVTDVLHISTLQVSTNVYEYEWGITLLGGRGGEETSPLSSYRKQHRLASSHSVNRPRSHITRQRRDNYSKWQSLPWRSRITMVCYARSWSISSHLIKESRIGWTQKQFRSNHGWLPLGHHIARIIV